MSDFLVDDVKSALQSFGCAETVGFKADRIAAKKAESVKWLENAITSA